MAVSGEQEAPVGVGLRRTRGEPPVRQRERTRQGVVEGDVALVPIAHGHVARRGDEPGHGSAGDRLMGGVPGLVGLRLHLALARHPERADHPARHGVRVAGPPELVEPEPVSARSAASRQHPEVVVERVVLHHDDHDVVDRDARIGSTGRTVTIRDVAGSPGRPGGRWSRQAGHTAHHHEPSGPGSEELPAGHLQRGHVPRHGRPAMAGAHRPAGAFGPLDDAAPSMCSSLRRHLAPGLAPS